MMTRTAFEIGGLRCEVSRLRRALRLWRTMALLALICAATALTCRAALDTALALPVLTAEVAL